VAQNDVRFLAGGHRVLNDHFDFGVYLSVQTVSRVLRRIFTHPVRYVS
jgi:hypothetical protein